MIGCWSSSGQLQICQCVMSSLMRRQVCLSPKVMLTTFTILHVYIIYMGARGSVVGWGTMLQAGRSLVQVLDDVDFSIYLILPAALWPWGRLSLQQKLVPGIFLRVKSGRRVGLATLPAPMSQMSENVGASTSRNPKGLHSLHKDKFTLTFTLYILHSLSKICHCPTQWKITNSEFAIIQATCFCASWPQSHCQCLKCFSRLMSKLTF
jgi:hypothetical protein